MSSASKYIQIADQFKRRLVSGDYHFSSIPGVQHLATEAGVSYMTARQAVQKLIDDGVLVRNGKGRLEVGPVGNGHRQAKLRVAMVQSLYQDPHSVWVQSVKKTAESRGASLRQIVYCHNDDPLLFDALDGDFDLIFLFNDRNDSLFLEKLAKQRDRLVVFFNDFTRYGIRCLDGLAPAAVEVLIEELRRRGHRTIDCFNAQPMNASMEARIGAWASGLEKFGCSGTLHNHPVERFNWSAMHAFDAMNGILDRGELKADALFFTASDAGLSILRSLYDHGIRVPEDLSVAGWGRAREARLAIPSLTVIDTPDPGGLVRGIFDHYLGVRPDPDRLMFRPAMEHVLVPGESVADRRPRD